MQLPNEEAETFIEACQERGEEFEAYRQFGQLYSFARLEAPVDPLYTFDSDGLIQTALQLSRLIVLNSHCTEWSVRVISGDLPERQIVPARCSRRFFAHHVGSDARDWLVQSEANDLGRLLRRFLEIREGLPQRVKNCLWTAEWGARIPYFQPALVNTVTCLEALLNAGDRRLKAQFMHRTCALAEELGVEGVTESDAGALYVARSKNVHGRFVPIENQSAASARLIAFQTLLARTLRRAIESDDFVQRFQSAGTVREAWPLPPASP